MEINEIKVDMTGKVILSLNEYVKLTNEITLLREKCDKKYDDLLNYLFSECEIVNYSSGRKGLQYGHYNNHLTEYLKKIEPEKYENYLKELMERGDEE